MMWGTLKGKQMWSNGQTSMMASVCKESEVQFGDYVKRPKRPGEWPDRCDGKCLHLPAGLEQHGKGGHRVERSEMEIWTGTSDHTHNSPFVSFSLQNAEWTETNIRWQKERGRFETRQTSFNFASFWVKIELNQKRIQCLENYREIIEEVFGGFAVPTPDMSVSILCENKVEF